MTTLKDLTSHTLDTIISHLLSFLKSNFASLLESHTMFLLAGLVSIIIYFSSRANFILLSRSYLLILAFSYFLVTLVLLRFQRRVKSNGSPLSWNLLSRFPSLYVRTPMLFATKFLLSSAAKYMKLHRLRPLKWKYIRLVRRSYVSRPKIIEHFEL